MKADIDILKEILLGQFISRFSLGDTWDMFIGEFCLSAHTVRFEDEDRISILLKENYKEFKYTTDRDDIAKSAIMCANLRKSIINIDLDHSKNIRLDFENGSTLEILTNTSVVDWQWSLNKSGKSPYSDYEIACFWKGETEIKI